jgi:hypothetical protein
MGLEDIIVDSRRESDDLRPQLGEAGSIIYYFQLFNEVIKPEDGFTIGLTRNLGSSFILGHTGRGWLGTPPAASIALGSYGLLGDSRGAWVWQRVSSPNNEFTEYFQTDTFKSGVTTGSWAATGSYTGPGSPTSNPVYLGSSAINNATLFYSGDNTGFLMTATGSNWEPVTSGLSWTPTKSGSDLRWKGNVVHATSKLFWVEVDYNLR